MPGWDPDAIAGPVPTSGVPKTVGQWDPDAHVDAAQNASTKTLKKSSFWDHIGVPEDMNPEVTQGQGQQLQVAPHAFSQLAGGFLDATNQATSSAADKDAVAKDSFARDQTLGISPPANDIDRAVRMVGGLGALNPSPEGNPTALPNPQQPVQAGLTLGQATGNTGIQAVESTLGRMPGGAPVRNAVAAQRAANTSGIQDVVDNLAGARGTTPYSVGTNLDSALTKGAQDLKDAGGALFDKIDANMKDAQVTPTVTQKVLGQFTNLPKGAENTAGVTVDPYLKQLQAGLQKDLDANAGFIPYDSLKQVQQQLNSKIDWTGVSGNANNGALKQVYLAIRNDLNETAKTYGQGDAVATANQNWGDVKDRLDAIDKAMSGNGGSEQIFNRLVSGSKAGPSGLMAVMDAIPDSSQKLLAAGMLQKMGMKGGASGEFDADTFASNWSKMDPDAKNRLFGSLPQNYRQNIDKVIQNVKDLKAYNNVLPNASNTASAGFWAGTMSGVITPLLMHQPGIAAAVAGTAGTTNLLAKALTNPRIVKFLASESDPTKVLKMGRLAGVGAQSAQAQAGQ